MTQVIEGIPKSDQATAAHELGHWFTARDTDLQPGKIYVHRWMGGGKCMVKADEDMATEAYVYAQGVVSAGGKVAETIWREFCGVPSPWSWGTGDDYAYLHDIAEYTGKPIGFYEDAARDLLLLAWHELEPLIEPLARKGYLRDPGA